ncbi:STY4528 family pathogenicity island replication protein [Azotobacter salinestris]|uniref:STY4528 family pathogenicity island replication protein n=1 Tax=Azotobacter salinestris TaxID=69964 RepID=UPI0032DF26A4
MRRVSIDALLSSAVPLLERQQRSGQTGNGDPARPVPSIPGTEGSGVLFTGNPHETVPRRLLLDNRLTPLERNAWQVFRLLINDDGLTAFPSYEQLRPYLATQPFRLASRETISKALVILRMTRWISLATTVRSDTGQVRGNIYLLHDEPIDVGEAMRVDASYMELVGQSLTHANRAISDVAERVLAEINEEAEHPQDQLPTHLDRIGARLMSQSWVAKTTEFGIRTQGKNQQSSESVLSEIDRVRNRSDLSSESVLSLKSSTYPRVRIPNSLSSTKLFTNTSICKSFVQDSGTGSGSGQEPPSRRAGPAVAAVGLTLPALMDTLAPKHRQTALITLQRIDPSLRQALLDQWAERCSRQTVRNPVGYLFGLMQKAIRGEFNAQPETCSRPGAPTPEATAPAAPIELARNDSTESPSRQRAGTQDLRTAENLAANRRSIAAIRSLIRPWRQTPPSDSP